MSTFCVSARCVCSVILLLSPFLLICNIFSDVGPGCRWMSSPSQSCRPCGEHAWTAGGGPPLKRGQGRIETVCRSPPRLHRTHTKSSKPLRAPVSPTSDGCLFWTGHEKYAIYKVRCDATDLNNCVKLDVKWRHKSRKNSWPFQTRSNSVAPTTWAKNVDTNPKGQPRAKR